MEYKITVTAIPVKVFPGGIPVILHNLGHNKVAMTDGLAGPYIIELCTKILSNKTFGTGYKYLHIIPNEFHGI